jgi:hypothetical protein
MQLEVELGELLNFILMRAVRTIVLPRKHPKRNSKLYIKRIFMKKMKKTMK